MKINSRYEPQLDGFLNLERLFGQYHYTVTTSKQEDTSLDYLSKPLVAHINVTDRCNLNCHYCYARDEVPQKQEMSELEYLTVLDTLKRENIFMVYFSGGEPSMNPSVNRILQHSINCGFIVVLLTNLVDISRYDISLLRSKQIQVQLGLNDVWNDNRENFINLQSAIQNFSYLQNLGIKINATIMIDKNHINLKRLMCFLSEKSVLNIRFGLMIREGKMKEYQLSDDYITYSYAVMRELNELAKEFPDVKISFQNEPNLYKKGLFSRRMEMCEAGTSQLYVDCDGTVFPCPLFKAYSNYICGNILTDSFNNIWESNIMKKFRNVSVNITGCSSCNELCGVWCRGLVYSYSGDLNGHSPFCYKKSCGDDKHDTVKI